MLMKKMLHATGKTMTGACRIFGDYLETIDNRLEMIVSRPSPEYATIETRKDRKKSNT
jgi:hypothetical protein